MFAYVDSGFSGLVPCRIVSHAADKAELHVQITGGRSSYYKRGDFAVLPYYRVVPRDRIRRRREGAIILPYSWPDILSSAALA